MSEIMSDINAQYFSLNEKGKIVSYNIFQRDMPI